MRAPRGFEALVEDHVRRWELARRAAAGAARPRPSLALSRRPGAGGAELGRLVAERLGLTFFGIEIVDRIAREGKVQRRLVEGLDEQVRSAIERYVLDALRPFDESAYLRGVVRTLNALAEQGGAVFLGRGAAFILPAERALRVLVTAGEDFRVERMMKARGLGREAARVGLHREEGARREFHRHHFGVDPEDSAHYDLVVNTGSLGLELAAELVAEAWRRRFGPGGGSRDGGGPPLHVRGRGLP